MFSAFFFIVVMVVPRVFSLPWPRFGRSAEAVDTDGWSVLHHAASAGSGPCVEVLTLLMGNSSTLCKVVHQFVSEVGANNSKFTTVALRFMLLITIGIGVYKPIYNFGGPTL